MKKLLTLILSMLMVVVAGVGMTACGSESVKVGAQTGTTSLMYVDCLKGVESKAYETFPLAIYDLKNDNIDYVMVDKATAVSLVAEYDGIAYKDIAFTEEYYGIGIDPAQANLKTQIDNVLTAKSAEIEQIKNDFLSGNTSGYTGVVSAEKDLNRKDEQLVLATNAEFPPWESKDGGVYYGIDMEIAKIIATELNLELVIEHMAFESVCLSVGKQGIDIAMSGITITVERAEMINFSIPYYTETIVLVYKEGDSAIEKAITVVDLLNVICVNK